MNNGRNDIMKKICILTAIILLMLTCSHRVFAEKKWPAEDWRSAEILTSLDPDFQNNMSGACYNPKTGFFWVCRNGGPSAFWALTEDRTGLLAISVNKSGKAAKYELTGGDLEGICQVDYDRNLVYLIREGEDKIAEYDVSSYGKARLENTWNISAYVPTKGGSGSEGITFVPDAWLVKGKFTDAGGKLYVSKNGMGGLMFVAHQNGGRIYVFDLNPENSSVHFVGAYRTSRSESSGLEFDRSTGLLYIWHNTGPNYLEVAKLSSVKKGRERCLRSVAEYIGPRSGNLEGIALTPAVSKNNWCLITDDDNQDGAAIMLFRKFKKLF